MLLLYVLYGNVAYRYSIMCENKYLRQTRVGSVFFYFTDFLFSQLIKSHPIPGNMESTNTTKTTLVLLLLLLFFFLENTYTPKKRTIFSQEAAMLCYS